MAAATTQAPKQIDLKNPDLYVQAVPHDLFAWLRVNDPVHWNREEDGAGFWSLTRHEDIVRASTKTCAVAVTVELIARGKIARGWRPAQE